MATVINFCIRLIVSPYGPFLGITRSHEGGIGEKGPSYWTQRLGHCSLKPLPWLYSVQAPHRAIRLCDWSHYELSDQSMVKVFCLDPIEIQVRCRRFDELTDLGASSSAIGPNFAKISL
jgi:hypothetical protein